MGDFHDGDNVKILKEGEAIRLAKGLKKRVKKEAVTAAPEDVPAAA